MGVSHPTQQHSAKRAKKMFHAMEKTLAGTTLQTSLIISLASTKTRGISNSGAGKKKRPHAGSQAKQPTLEETLEKRETLHKDSRRAKIITEHVAQMIVLDNRPLSAVNNVGMKRLRNAHHCYSHKGESFSLFMWGERDVLYKPSVT